MVRMTVFHLKICNFAAIYKLGGIMIERKKISIKKIEESISVLWELLTEKQREFLLSNIEIHSFQINEIIYNENDSPKFLMCLMEGKVKIYMDGVGGRNQIIRMIKQNGIFGFRAAFAGENYLNTASACEPSVICMIPITVIKTLMQENNRLSLFFVKQLSTMLGIVDTRTVSLTQKHIRGRLAESLISLKDKYGVEEDGSTLSIYLSREDLACLSNMTTSNAIRTLSAFAQENLIALDGRKIKIINENELRNISEMG